MNAKKTGHYKADWPTLKGNPSKEKFEKKQPHKYNNRLKKNQKAFWADSDEESTTSEAEKEEVNLCLMAEGETSSSDEDQVCEPTYEELYTMFEKLHDSYTSLKKKYRICKKNCETNVQESEALNEKV
uniref:hypothetical protein n=1 Tax=Streptococcus anginosus TaxID=1328 RepID=UPI002ED869C2